MAEAMPSRVVPLDLATAESMPSQVLISRSRSTTRSEPKGPIRTKDPPALFLAVGLELNP